MPLSLADCLATLLFHNLTAGPILQPMNGHPINRREFVTASTALIAAAAVPNRSSQLMIQSQTIGDVIDMIRKSIPLDVSKGTVDTIKCGDPQQPLTGIVTTMFATVEVIRATAQMNANLIIAHEPTFYNHNDEKEWLSGHPVLEMKLDLLNRNKIVIWRFHDHWHAHRPDGVLMGVLTRLGWEKYYDWAEPLMVKLPGPTLAEIIRLSKERLGIAQVRYIGDLSLTCKRVAVLPGAWGGRRHIETLHRLKPDLLICGELQEWETSEYVRDLRALGLNSALLVLGHSVSEEPGMEWLVTWLEPKVPGVKIAHIPSGNPFSFA